MAFISHDVGRAANRLYSGRVSAVCLGLLGMVLLGAGALPLAALPWRQVESALVARTWPVAEARIISVALEEVRTPTPRGPQTDIALRAEYEFETPNGLVVATRVGLAERAPEEDRHLLSIYRKVEFARQTGHAMMASYNPARPADAYLDISLPWIAMVPRIGLGLVVMFFGASWLARAGRQIAEARSRR